jgi:hypothetical protein
LTRGSEGLSHGEEPCGPRPVVCAPPCWIGRVHHSTDVAPRYGLRLQEAPVEREMALGDRSLMPEELEENDHAAIVSF